MFTRWICSQSSVHDAPSRPNRMWLAGSAARVELQFDVEWRYRTIRHWVPDIVRRLNTCRWNLARCQGDIDVIYKHCPTWSTSLSTSTRWHRKLCRADRRRPRGQLLVPCDGTERGPGLRGHGILVPVPTQWTRARNANTTNVRLVSDASWCAALESTWSLHVQHSTTWSLHVQHSTTWSLHVQHSTGDTTYCVAGDGIHWMIHFLLS